MHFSHAITLSLVALAGTRAVPLNEGTGDHVASVDAYASSTVGADAPEPTATGNFTVGAILSDFGIVLPDELAKKVESIDLSAYKDLNVTAALGSIGVELGPDSTPGSILEDLKEWKESSGWGGFNASQYTSFFGHHHGGYSDNDGDDENDDDEKGWWGWGWGGKKHHPWDHESTTASGGEGEETSLFSTIEPTTTAGGDGEETSLFSTIVPTTTTSDNGEETSLFSTIEPTATASGDGEETSLFSTISPPATSTSAAAGEETSLFSTIV